MFYSNIFYDFLNTSMTWSEVKWSEKFPMVKNIWTDKKS